MELKEAIYNRRSVRVFQDKEIETEKIHQMIDAAQWAPSACNKQGWKFIIVSNKETKEAIVGKAGANHLIKTAPLVIFVLYEKHLTESKFSYIQSASAAIQNLLLTAHNLGLGAAWITGMGDLEVIKKELKIPNDYEIIASIILGYSGESPLAPKRKKIEDISSFNYFNFTEGPYPFTYDVKKWTLKQVIKFREDSMRAASPAQNPFPFSRFNELEKEIRFVSKGLSDENKILEIMPFAGSHTAAMLKHKKFKDYNLFELSKQPIEFIKERLSHNNINLDIKSSIGEASLPYQDNYFDTVAIFQKLEMLPDLKILSEIFRVLRPGGKLFISFKNMTSLYGLYYWFKFRIFNKEPIWNYGPFTPLSYFKIKKILKEKFEIKKEAGITPLFFIGRISFYPLSFLGRLVVFEAIPKK